MGDVTMEVLTAITNTLWISLADVASSGRHEER